MDVLRYLVILLVALSFLDLWLLMEIASAIGFWQTLALVAATGLIGAELVRREGRLVRKRIVASVTLEEVSRNFLEAAVLVLSGLMLVSPGIVTDLLGLLMSLQPVRQRLVVKVSRKLDESGSLRVEVYSF